MKLIPTTMAVAFAAALLPVVSSAQTTPTWKFEPGFSYSSGDYGLASDTEVYAVPVALSFETSAVTLRGSIAWLSITGPATVAGGIGVPARPTTSKESGFGDVSVALTLKAPSDPTRWNFSVTGRVKLATADESKGLGTGENDFHAQIDLLKSWPSVTPFFSAGYRWLGASPVYPLEDGPYAAAGLAFPVSPEATFSVSGEWREAIVAGGDDALEASVSLFRRMERWTVSLNAMTGFNDASPNFGAGVTLGLAL